MAVPEKIKSFFKPSALKIILTIVILIYAFYAAFMVYPWGHSPSPIPVLLFMPLMFAGILSLILAIPYSYLISCLIVLLFNSIKTKKWLLVLVIVVFVLLTGIDEPVLNNTINSPDYSCSVDSDCVVKSISKGWCGNPQCVNQDWEYYDSVINSVFALSCRMPLYSCSCVENRCESKDLYKSTDINDCEKLEGYQKEECIRMVSYNINRTNE
jgi:hypothetical protein